MYLTFGDFIKVFPDEQELKDPRFSALASRAESDIDALTFNRITAIGFESLTDFQKSLVKRATAIQVKFLHDNSELLNSPLSAYSISGVSMTFDRSKVVEIGSVTTSREVYGLIMQTGLCYGGIK